jgi:Protein of unknown function (DUF2846)
MRNSVVDRICRARGAHRIPAIVFFAFFVLALFGGFTAASAQDAKTAAPPPSAPSPGKALVYIYRTYRFTGSASHDHLFINGVYWVYLKSSEYAWMEVDPGNVSVTGTTATYTVDIFTAAATATHEATKKENERIHFDAEAGKTYYLKWTSDTMGTGVKVTMEDPEKGAKEMSKLKLSDPVEQPKDAPKPGDASKQGAK